MARTDQANPGEPRWVEWGGDVPAGRTGCPQDAHREVRVEAEWIR
jgi:hypothetical protein